MLKTIRDMLIGALVIGAVTAAIATTGTPPIPSNGFGLVDGAWLNGLAGGLNNTFQSGFTALGTTQATALQLPSGIYLMEVDTTASSTGVALPPCVAGTEVWVYNHGAQPLTVYPAIANNAQLSPPAQDTINGGMTLSGNLATLTSESFVCAKTGNWGIK